jgi:hypothetical protein
MHGVNALAFSRIIFILLSSIIFNYYGYNLENTEAENKLIEFYSLIKNNRIDEAFDIAHYENQYMDFKEFSKNEFKKYDWSETEIELLSSERINRNLTAFFVRVISPHFNYSHDETAEVNNIAKIFVLYDNHTHIIVHQDFNIPNEYRHGVVIDESQIMPEHITLIE